MFILFGKYINYHIFLSHFSPKIRYQETLLAKKLYIHFCHLLSGDFPITLKLHSLSLIKEHELHIKSIGQFSHLDEGP